ncbi:hypothetical protein HZH68_003928 [Vespula germanica]|uniref:Uncharacterized protein n=1 Tax=Vespula germanica TaxID=30212 RepID=A0A834NHI3_VESGE|nr:hypothetical protein HZH68_003928 [Vespula germanica]
MWTSKIWAYSAQRVLSNGPGPVPLDAIVSEKKIVKGKFFFTFFYINRNISAPVGEICTKKIWGFRAQRGISSGTWPAAISTIVSATSGRQKYVRLVRKESFPTAPGPFL